MLYVRRTVYDGVEAVRLELFRQILRWRQDHDAALDLTLGEARGKVIVVFRFEKNFAYIENR